jgi:hypothetical protein
VKAESVRVERQQKTIPIKSFWESRTLFTKRVLAAGGSMLLHPIQGRGVFQRSNIISNLIGSMRRMLAAGPKSATCFFNILEKKMPGGETACFAPTWTRGDFLSMSR